MARVLIVGGGCRGRELARTLIEGGHVVRITTRGEHGREAIERTGAECYIGDPGRLATFRGSLEHVTVACWLLAGAAGSPEQLAALHSSRLASFLSHAIDTTLRGFVYERPGAPDGEGPLAAGEQMVRSLGAKNAIPVSFITTDPGSAAAWLGDVQTAVARLLGGEPRAS